MYNMIYSMHWKHNKQFDVYKYIFISYLEFL